MKDAEIIFEAALKSVNPELLVKGYADKIMSYYSMNNFTKLVVAGFGKAAYQMAKTFEESVESGTITEGIIVTKYGHAEKQRSAVSDQQSGLKKIKSMKQRILFLMRMGQGRQKKLSGSLVMQMRVRW